MWGEKLLGIELDVEKYVVAAGNRFCNTAGRVIRIIVCLCLCV